MLIFFCSNQLGKTTFYTELFVGHLSCKSLTKRCSSTSLRKSAARMYLSISGFIWSQVSSTKKPSCPIHENRGIRKLSMPPPNSTSSSRRNRNAALINSMIFFHSTSRKSYRILKQQNKRKSFSGLSLQPKRI